MEQTTQFLKKFVELLGFSDFQVESDLEHRHVTIFIRDHATIIQDNLPMFVEHINHVAQLAAKKYGESSLFVDVNNYRRERENLIGELARAAARKVMVTKQEISLPAMNSYERRVVHTALAAHPEVITESSGEGKNRYVVVRPLGTEKKVEINGDAIPAREEVRTGEVQFGSESE